LFRPYDSNGRLYSEVERGKATITTLELQHHVRGIVLVCTARPDKPRRDGDGSKDVWVGGTVRAHDRMLGHVNILAPAIRMHIRPALHDAHAKLLVKDDGRAHKPLLIQHSTIWPIRSGASVVASSGSESIKLATDESQIVFGLNQTSGFAHFTIEVEVTPHRAQYLRYTSIIKGLLENAQFVPLNVLTKTMQLQCYVIKHRPIVPHGTH
jgi:hypothetical protein